MTQRDKEFDYTSRDFKSIRSDAIERIENLLPEWTDHSETDPGITLLSLFSGMLDVAHYYIDQKALESYITTVRGRKSLIGLAALVGQRIKGKAAAKTSVVFSLQSPLTQALTIPAGTTLQTNGITPPITFETTEAVVIPAGQTISTEVPAVAGITTTTTLGVSDGSPYQAYRITNDDEVLDDGILVFVDGTPWSFIPSLGMAKNDDEVWTYVRDEFGRVEVRFGWGTETGGNGKIPPNGAQITASYRIGGGVTTNVGAGVIRTVVSTIYSGGNPVSVSVNNPVPAVGGAEIEPVRLARQRVPYLFKAQERGIRRSDVKALCEAVPGVLQAQPVVDGIGSWTVYISAHPFVGVGSGTDQFGYPVLENQKESVRALAEYVQSQVQPKILQTDTLTVVPATDRKIDISVVVWTVAGYNLALIERRVAEAFDTFFDPLDAVIGETSTQKGNKHPSDLVSLLESIDGVDHVGVLRFSLQPLLEYVQTAGEPVLSSVTLTQFTTSAIWEILFTSPETFVVYRYDINGQNKKKQKKRGAFAPDGIVYVSDDSEVEFVLSLPEGAKPPLAGDTLRFRTSPLIGTAPILTGEIARRGDITVEYRTT